MEDYITCLTFYIYIVECTNGHKSLTLRFFCSECNKLKTMNGVTLKKRLISKRY